jgi:selenocysteine-specific elongation factor
MPGDRFVLRGFAPQKNHGTTIGGGVVLRTLSSRQRRGSAQLVQTLSDVATTLLLPRTFAGAGTAAAALPAAESARAATEKLVMLEVERQGILGVGLKRLRMAVPASEEALRSALQALLEDGRLLALPQNPELLQNAEETSYFTRAVPDELAALIAAILGAYHQKEPRSSGLPRETLRAQAAAARAGLPLKLFQHVLDGLLLRGDVQAENDLLRLSSHQVSSDEQGQLLVRRLAAVYDEAGLAPPRLQEAAAPLGGAAGTPSKEALHAAAAALLRDRVLIRIKDLLYHRAHVDELEQRLRRYLDLHGEITPAAWKELCGQTRKFSIPLAEHFDAEKVTLRVGDLRRRR